MSMRPAIDAGLQADLRVAAARKTESVTAYVNRVVKEAVEADQQAHDKKSQD